jgi:multidrug efflux pump subunit AcrA (membrane-fusion protein)
LRRIEAMVRSATNEIARAQLALSRTSVRAPFNAMVLAESVESGQLVSNGEEIATLVGTDEFWVQATLDVPKLRHIALPGPNRPGARAQVILDVGNGGPVAWSGTVIRLLSDLTTGRMARMLISVKDPLRLKSETDKLPLLLGSYVRVEIEAGTLENVLAIPQIALRENDSIWVVDSENRLQIRPAERLWSQDDQILIANVINPGEQLIVSGLRTALPGMEVEPQLIDADSAGAPEPALSSISSENPIQSTP